MCKIIYFFVIIASCLASTCLGSHCYPNFCYNKTSRLKNNGPECVLTEVQRGKDCVNWRFENLGYNPPLGKSLGKFRLSAYVNYFGSFYGRTTAFNLSISDIKFTRLITRFQELGNDRQAACRQIEIYGNDGNSSFPEMFVSCPFEEDRFEAVPYRLEYLAVGHNFAYSRKFVFVVPRHIHIDKDANDVKTYLPFLYIDVSNMGTLVLHVQALPESFNVTQYKVWLINNETKSVASVDLNLHDEPELRYNFSIVEGMHYFKVAAMHPSCGEFGCVNGTSPLISTKKPTRRLLIMIISVVWIPPVIFYAIYHAYKLYMKNVSAKRGQRRMNCLLVYSPTHGAHVRVMEKLALYMRSCNINAMIDTLSIPETVNKDPGLWCNSAFQSADVIVVATSPPPSDAVVPVIYRNMDNHALRLLKENYSRRNKSYFAVQFPYCKRDDIPEEARLFRRFEMPQELDKLVRNIYHVDRVRFFGVSSREFLESIRLAMAEIPRRKIKESKIVDVKDAEARQSDELLPSSMKREEIKRDKNYCTESKTFNDVKTNRRNFTTNIDELNLLGENVDVENIVGNSQNSDVEFRIDRLNL